MTVQDIKTRVNQDLAGEQLSWKMMLAHINWAIDEINSELNANFPIVDETTTEYTAFPDNYIRMVVVPGAVHHYFMVDDEGTTAEQDFNMLFRQGIFKMLRDYSHLIPEQYQADADNGAVDSTYEDWGGTRGVQVLGWNGWW